MSTDTMAPVQSPAPLPTQTTEQAARLNAIAAKQAITGPPDLESIRLACNDLWANDAEFEAFIESIRQIRSQKD